MTHASKVADADARRQEQTYFWISNHKALFLRHIPDTRYYEALERDIDTGTETYLKGFNGRYRSLMVATPMHCRMVDKEGNLIEPVEIVYLPPACSLSPDGRWLVWRSWERKPTEWIAATVDGAGERKWADIDPISSGEPHWMPDGRRWVESRQQYSGSRYRFTGAVLHSLEDTGADQVVRLSNAKDGIVKGITQNGNLLIARYPYGERCAKVDFSACGLQPGIAVTRDYSVPLPRALAIYGIALSPQGDRLAWLLGDTDEYLAAGNMIEVWVSDLKGREMQEVDRVPVLEQKTDAGRTIYDLPDELLWLPDGESLSFLYQNALWVVPIT